MNKTGELKVITKSKKPHNTTFLRLTNIPEGTINSKGTNGINAEEDSDGLRTNNIYLKRNWNVCLNCVIF